MGKFFVSNVQGGSTELTKQNIVKNFDRMLRDRKLGHGITQPRDHIYYHIDTLLN